MSYSSHSLGAGSAFTSFSSKTGTSLSPRANVGPPVEMTDVGVDPSLFIAMRSFLTKMRDSPVERRGASRIAVVLGLAYMAALRPNQFGRFDTAKVSQALMAIPEADRAILDSVVNPLKADGRQAYFPAVTSPETRALSRYTISKLLADIAAGRYAGTPAPTRTNLVRAGIKMPLPGGGLLTKAPPKDPEPPPAREGVKEVMCTDGYVRDADGLCVPGAAPPVQEKKPAVAVEEPKKEEEQPPAATQEVVPKDPRVDGERDDMSWHRYGPPEPAIPSEIVEQAAPSKGPLGLAWKWWLIGGASVVGVGLWMSSNKVTPNKRRSRSRSR